MAFVAQPRLANQPSKHRSTAPKVKRVRRPSSGLPFAFVRGSLFGVNDKCKDRLESQELQAVRDISLTYSGPRLNQTHSMLWQAIVAIWIRNNNERVSEEQQDHVTIGSAALLREIGWKNTSTRSRRWLWDRLIDLQTARLELRTSRQRYSGFLLTEVYRDETLPAAPLTVRVNPRVIMLLKNEVVFTDFDRKLELAGKQLALWLHDFISSQSNDKFIRFTVGALHALCGSKQALAQFRPRLIEAAKALQATTTPLLTSFTIDKGDHFIFSKSKTTVLLLPEAAAKALTYQSKHDEAVDQARAQRAGVAL